MLSARTVLIDAAAATWNVEPETCHARQGRVIHTPTERSLSYGELAGKAASMPVPKTVALKDPKDFTLIGKPVKRIEGPAKINGTAVYGIDAKVPGMKIGTVAACPVFGGKLKNVTDDKALAVKDVHQVVRLDNAVAIIAANTGAAKKGLAALEIDWDEGPNAALTTADIVNAMAKVSEAEGVAARNIGNVTESLASAETKVEAIYQLPFLALWGEITLKSGRVEQSNFDNYKALRINEMPVMTSISYAATRRRAAWANRERPRSRLLSRTPFSPRPPCVCGSFRSIRAN